MTTETILHAHGLVLEPFVPAHAHALFAAMQAPELYTFIPHEPPASLERLRDRFVRLAARKNGDGTEVWLNYAVREATSPTYVRTVQATVVPSGESTIAYEVYPPFQRRGFARAACRALIAHVFACWPVDAVHAYVDTRNVASYRLLESLGFRRVRSVPNADFFKGASSDEHVYALARVGGRAPTEGAELPIRVGEAPSA
ncbi:MAG: GNAT family N-acetyltransferase [Sandaracinus sp.]|nr:GNAT family N-acetyltransferase [Sandaracinus sp.]MCB9617969.1 GNAT family N-acetyltransferase [Sandaracinus sp.]MCB9622486.1 GNAT family N-acetyltransferase [Sandaracinus sp.]